jgi:hypothetical protein
MRGKTPLSSDRPDLFSKMFESARRELRTETLCIAPTVPGKIAGTDLWLD